MAKIIQGSEFDKEVIKSDKPVMVDFFATWCGPCKMIAPAVEELSNEMGGKVKVLKMDIDEESASQVAMQYNIRSVPTLMFFKNGQVFDKIIGAMPKASIAEKLNKMI